MPHNSLRSGGLACIRTHICWLWRVSQVSAVATFTFSLLKLPHQIMSHHCRLSESSKCLTLDTHEPVLNKAVSFILFAVRFQLGQRFPLPRLMTHFFGTFHWQQDFQGCLIIESQDTFICTCFFFFITESLEFGWVDRTSKYWVSKRAAQHGIYPLKVQWIALSKGKRRHNQPPFSFIIWCSHTICS